MGNKKFKELLSILMKWKHLGVVKVKNKAGAIMIAHIPRDFPEAYLYIYYKGLTNDQIKKLEKKVDKKFPEQYKEFLKCSNGVQLFHFGGLTVDGLRFNYERVGDESIQPYDLLRLNYELAKYIPKEWLAIGGYLWDGSIVYFDISNKSNKVFRCKKYETKILQEWPDFWSWLINETKRIAKMYNKDGYKINPNEPTVK